MCVRLCAQNIVRPYDETFEHLSAGSGIMLSHWRGTYKKVGATPPETWELGVFRPDGHSVSVSDIYFVAHALGMVHTKRTTVASFLPDGVSTVCGSRFEAQLVAKCIGFEVNEGTERLLGRSRMLPSMQAGQGLFVSFEPHLDHVSNGLPLIGYVNAVNYTADALVYFWRQAALLPAHDLGSQVRINGVTASETKAGLMASLSDPAAMSMLRSHVDGLVSDTQSSWRPEEYLLENTRQWDELNTHLLAIVTLSQESRRERFSYPFADALKVLQFEAPECLQQQQPTPSAGNGMPSARSPAASAPVQNAGLLSLSPAERRVHIEAAVLRIVRELSSDGIVEADTPLMEAGVDSLAASELSQRLRALHDGDVDISPTILLEQPTSRLLADHLLRQMGSLAEIPVTTTVRAEGDGCATKDEGKIVVCSTIGSWVGGCGRVAGPMLAACGDAVGSVPLARWQEIDSIGIAHISTDVQNRGVLHGSFVAGAHFFDCGAFQISSAEAAAMDPQQRMLLEKGYEAFHGANLRRALLEGSNGGTHVGMELPDWHAVKPSYGSGDATCVASGRLSFVLGLHGPCKTIDTACSSGLCAAHAAVSSVRTSESRFALGSGVSLKLRPHPTLYLAIAGTVSADGRCKTFDARANGYARAEGLGALVLSSSVHGFSSTLAMLIAVSHNGRSASLTAPNGAAQRMLFSSLWSSLHESSLLCSEAHGTGTTLGDATEANALLAAHTQRVLSTSLHVSSHKANTGHEECPSGLMGLLGCVQRLEQHLLYGNAQLRILNPMVAQSAQRRPLSFPLLSVGMVGHAYSCGVTGWGHSGTNAHALLAQTDAAWSKSASSSRAQLAYRRLAFSWLESAWNKFDSELSRALHLTDDIPLVQAGLNSLGAVRLASLLRKDSGIDVPPTLLFTFPTARAIAAHLQDSGASTTAQSVLALVADIFADVVGVASSPLVPPPSSSQDVCDAGLPHASLIGLNDLFVSIGLMCLCPASSGVPLLCVPSAIGESAAMPLHPQPSLRTLVITPNAPTPSSPSTARPNSQIPCPMHLRRPSHSWLRNSNRHYFGTSHAFVGHADIYKGLSSVVNVPIYGAIHPHLQTGSHLDAVTLEQFADAWAISMLQECERLNCRGSFSVLGASLGGLYAHQLAYAAQTYSGIPPQLLVLVDPLPPTRPFSRPLSSGAREAAWNTVALLYDGTFEMPEAADADLGILLAERAAKLGLAPFTPATVLERQQELRAAKHLLDLASSYTGREAGPEAHLECLVCLVVASEREDFFMQNCGLLREECGLAAARRYGRVVAELDVTIKHLDLCVRCATGDLNEFNAMLRHLLQDAFLTK